MIYAKMSTESRDALRGELLTAKDAKWYRRLKIIELSNTGLPVPKLAEMFDLCPATVRDYYKGWTHFAQAEGRVFFASCRGEELSFEWEEQGHGAFTYFLLEALKGIADMTGDGFVTFSETAVYVTDNVIRWAHQRGLSQTPEQYASELKGEILLTQVP